MSKKERATSNGSEGEREEKEETNERWEGGEVVNFVWGNVGPKPRVLRRGGCACSPVLVL